LNILGRLSKRAATSELKHIHKEGVPTTKRSTPTSKRRT